MSAVRRLVVLAVLAGLAAPAALAQVPEEVMELQRCIWRCQAEHGLTEAYGACTQQYCSEASIAAPASVLPPFRAQPAPPPGPGVLSGAWRFAVHPALGPTAHVVTQAGTVGIGCGGGGGADMGLRFSNSLASARRVTLMISPGVDASSYPRLQGDWSGRDGDACSVPVQALATGDALYFIPADIRALNATADGGNLTTLSDGTRTAEVRTPAEALAAFGGYVVPLTGAHQALDAFLQSCPPAAEEVSYGCGD